MQKYFTILLIIIFKTAFSQAPQIEWAKCFGGSDTDRALSVVSTADGGYLLCGSTASNDSDVSFNHGDLDAWVVKVDGNGAMEWEKSYGGSNADFFRTILPLKTGNYILCGQTASNDGDVDTSHGLTDYWVAEIAGDGTLIWENTYGGSSEDIATDIIPSDSGYMVIGQTFSSDGDVTGYKSNGDGWLIVIDPTGTLTDQKAKGGSGADIFNQILPLPSGGHIITGTSSSDDGSLAGLNHGGSDVWLTQLSKNGAAQWTQCFGDTGNDGSTRLVREPDGTYVVSCFFKTATSQDSWLLEVDSNGTLINSVTYGGDDTEQSGPIKKDPLGAYIVAPSSLSPISGDVECHIAANDIWMYSSSLSTSLNWQKCLGGTLDEFATQIVINSDSSMILSGYTRSTDGDVSGNNGDYDYWLVKLIPGCSAFADFTYSATGNLVTFDNQSTNADSYFWDFGDGGTATQENPSHTFPGIGAYEVCLTASSVDCAPFTFCSTVYICGPPVSTQFHFTLSDATATFTDQSTNANQWVWDFGDGKTSTDQNPVHEFESNGNFHVCLTASDVGCSSETFCQDIFICFYETVADFSYTVTGLDVQFFNEVQYATSIFWTFGDGGTSSGLNPSHTYPSDGVYEVCLIASDTCSSDTFCMEINVCAVPAAGFTYFASSNPVEINFVDESQNASQWLWDFGDGLTSSSANPQHLYGGPGVYEVCLVVSNDCGSDTTCQILVIECPPFQGDFDFVQDANTVVFNDLSGSTAVSWQWDFGDGGTSTLEDPTHVYGADGTYEVCLIVSDGCSKDTICKEVDVIGTFAGQPFTNGFMRVFPNPFSESTIIEFTLTSGSDLTITLNDVTGRTIRTIASGNYISGNHKLELNRENLASGIYQVRLSVGDETITQKVVIGN